MVCVPSFEMCSGSKIHYLIQMNSVVACWSIRRRFSCIRTFHVELRRTIRTSLPNFPTQVKESTFRKHIVDPRAGEKRRAALDSYFKQLFATLHSLGRDVFFHETLVAFFGGRICLELSPTAHLTSSRDIEPQRRLLLPGTLVRIRDDVTLPLHGWQGLDEHRHTIGVVMSAHDDTAVVAFKSPNRWVGVQSELDIIDHEDDSNDVVRKILCAHDDFSNSRIFIRGDEKCNRHLTKPACLPPSYDDSITHEQHQCDKVPGDCAGLQETAASFGFCDTDVEGESYLHDFMPFIFCANRRTNAA